MSVDGVVEELEHLPKRNPYRRGRKARQGSSGQDLNIMQEDPQPRVIFNSYSWDELQPCMPINKNTMSCRACCTTR